MLFFSGNLSFFDYMVSHFSSHIVVHNYQSSSSSQKQVSSKERGGEGILISAQINLRNHLIKKTRGMSKLVISNLP